MRGRFSVYGADRKPHTSILPYLRAKEAAEKKAQYKPTAQDPQADTTDTHTEESYAEAIRKIVAGEE